jgi:hypothetical protein
MPNFQNPRIQFSIRSDDSVQVWLNTQTTTLLAPSPANFGNAAYSPPPFTDASKFRVGRNCIYVLVEDVGNIYGFDLVGNVSALGVMPTAGAGTEVSFAPCSCSSGPAGPATGIGAATATTGIRADRLKMIETDDDRAVIASIVKIAEARRRQRSTR